jgi:hypothetical protein
MVESEVKESVFPFRARFTYQSFIKLSRFTEIRSIVSSDLIIIVSFSPKAFQKKDTNSNVKNRILGLIIVKKFKNLLSN